MKTKTLISELLCKLDACWRAANHLSVGQIYLYDNPLLKKPLKLAHIKPRLLGHIERGFQGLDVGDHVHVKLIHTDIERGFIDFARDGTP